MILFWKQNDGGIYGRRPDGLAKALVEIGAVRRVVFLDAPLHPDDMARRRDGQSSDRLEYEAAQQKQAGAMDHSGVSYRVFQWDPETERGWGPFRTGGRHAYGDWLAELLHRDGIDPRQSLAWVCPVVEDFARLHRQIRFGAVVADLIDDERETARDSTHLQALMLGYRAAFRQADAVFTNCAPMARRFSTMARQTPIVVPNGVDLPAATTGTPHPGLQNLPRPIAGYIGNLEQRIDWDMLAASADALPEVSFALVGGGDRSGAAARLAERPNVHLLGPVQSQDAGATVAGFDVALIPHQVADMTEAMNPLKAYLYLAVGRPVVTTPIANIDPELRPFLRVADGATAFAAAIREALAVPAPDLPEDLLRGITWTARAEAVAQALAPVLERLRRA